MLKKFFVKLGICLLFMCFVLKFLFPLLAIADEYPSKPIRIIVPMPPGGAYDLHARAFASVAHEYFGVPVIAVTKAGGGGAIGCNYVAQSNPDGYTLLLIGQEVITQPLLQNLHFSPESFVAVGRINYSPQLICVHNDSPWNTLKELVVYAREHPNKVSYGGVPGLQPAELTMEPFRKKAGIQLKFVPFPGGGPAFMGFLSKNIDIVVAFPSTVVDYMKQGKVRALAVGSRERLSEFPQVPTMMEQGFDHYFEVFRALFAPKGISDSRLKKLRELFSQTVKDKSFVSILEKMGEKVLYMSGDDFDKLMIEEVGRIKNIAKDLLGK